jgi:hypothetical protein
VHEDEHGEDHEAEGDGDGDGAPVVLGRGLHVRLR